MKNFIITAGKGKSCKKIFIPPSKSQTMRAILFASLAKKKSEISAYLMSPDTDAMIFACQQLGAQITKKRECLVIDGNMGELTLPKKIIDCRNSGLALRFMLSICSLIGSYSIITGDESLQNRRDSIPLIQALNSLGANIISLKNDGKCPLIIKGKIKAGQVEINASDSQFVSSLLIAATQLDGKTTLFIKNAKEKPFIAMTIDWLRRLGVQCSNDNFEKIVVFGKNIFSPFQYAVKGDFSSAAFLVVNALIQQKELILENLDFSDPQGDKALVFLLQKMNANFAFEENKLIIKKSPKLQGMTVDADDFIDAVPILAVLGCFVKDGIKIVNCASAKDKECDRLLAITSELKKMNADIQITDQGLEIRESKLQAGSLDSFNDHRIAMAMAIAANNAKGESIIKNVACVKKTYASFKEDLKKLGADIK